MIEVSLTCEHCDKKFLRRKSEADRNRLRGYAVFCSRRCRAQNAYKKLSKEQKKDYHIKRLNYKKVPTELSPFRRHLKSIKCHARKINKTVSITLEDLKKQWEKQNGICPITLWKMINPLSTTERPVHLPERASVDRIDSTKDYTVDNIRFVCLMAQFAKNNFPEEALNRFCNAIKNNPKF